MFSLPLVHRELLVAVRRKSGVWLRVGSTGLAIALGTLWLIGIAISGGSASAGSILFSIYKSMLYVGAALSGAFLTADSLSGERREGTLGLLFLTRLNGWQVATGKLTAGAMRALFVLLGIAPVLSITLLMGGVTSGDFWRLLLTISVTLWASLSLGLLVSAGSRAAGGGAITTIILIAAWESIGALAAFLETSTTSPIGSAIFHWLAFSPLQALGAGVDASYQLRPAVYWRNIGSIALSALAMTFVAGHIAQRYFHETLGGSTRLAAVLSKRRSPVIFGDDPDPLKKLLSSGSWPVLIAWFPVGLACLGIGAILVSGSPDAISGGSYAFGFLSIFPLGVLAWVRSHRFAELRQTGMLDMLLITPLENRRSSLASSSGILNSLNSASNVRIVRVIVALFLIQVLGLLISSAIIAAGARHSDSAWGQLLGGLGILGFQAVTVGLRFAAVSSVSLWFALSEPKPNTAFLKTAGLALFLPLFVPCLLEWGLTGALFGWARYKLNNPLRQILAQNPVRN